MDPSAYHILGATSDEPLAMGLDTRGSLAQAPYEAAVRRVYAALRRHLPPMDAYVRRIRKVPKTEENPTGQEAYAAAVTNPDRWACGEEGAQAALSLLTPQRIVDIIKARPRERANMVSYLTDQIAPRQEGPDQPYLGPNAPRVGQPGSPRPR